MNIAICDDSKRDRQFLLELLQTFSIQNALSINVAVFETGEELLRHSKPGHFQVALLDVCLDGIDGIAIARSLRLTDKDLAIIFLATNQERAVEAFSVQATHYLVKPITYTQLEEAMNRCKEKLDRFSRSIEIVHNRAKMRIRLRDIYYAEVFRKNCVIHTETGDITVKMAMNELEAMLGGKPFLRCHRSYIVNMSKVLHMRRNEFLMENGGRAFIGKTCAAASKNAFYLSRKPGAFDRDILTGIVKEDIMV